MLMSLMGHRLGCKRMARSDDSCVSMNGSYSDSTVIVSLE